jgi:hypothetical protein
LDSTLIRLLKKVEEAWRNAPKGEIASIDWDLFLNSQDPCANYKADSVKVVRAQFRVFVSGICESVEQERYLEAVLERRSRKWVIVNVQGPKGYDVIESLRAAYPDAK